MLVTGDRVQLTVRKDGTRDAIVIPGHGRERIGYLQRTSGDRLMVIPKDAQEPLAQGRVDPRLFDVTGLVEQRLSDELPLIVSGDGAGATKVRDLPSIGATAVTTRSGGVWSAMGPDTRIWLDGRREVLDDVSNPQIGVPAAWEAGYKGKGVTVAVLDTGVDANHPDLKGVVTASKDFTGTGEQDNVGHGTHVAGIIAGSGAASAGRYAGVAPEAKVLAGKVCATTSCAESAILAGMQWAAEQQADIVNLSLGGPDTPGVDPLEEAVNRLTGSLFVIAAGNSGPAAQTVSSPSTADAALSVASVSPSDTVSRFSSRGPRVGDFGLKPEIAAPGQSIVAARAAGTGMGAPVDANYTAASGTSMATPHVAGAAALLAQARPELTPTQLKDTLTSTAKAIGGTVPEQGAGRVDVARAVTQAVTATPAIAFGLLRYPSNTAPDQTKKITFRNEGDADVTLDLTLTGPAGFSLAAAKVTVPAHNQADVNLTVHPAALPATIGTHAGRITATDGKTVTQTVFAATSEVESYDVDVTLIGRDGAPAAQQYVYVTNLGTLPPRFALTDAVPYFVGNGQRTIRLPKGQYGFDASITQGSLTRVTMPTTTIDRDQALTFDARKGNPLGFAVQQKDAVPYINQLFHQYSVEVGGTRAVKSLIEWVPGENVFIVPAQGDPARFAFGLQGLLGPADDRRYIYNLAVAELGRIPKNTTFRFTNNQLAKVNSRLRGLGRTDTVAERAALPNYLPGQTFRSSPYVTVPLPGRQVEYYNSAPGLTFTQVMTPHRVGDPITLTGRLDSDKESYRPGTTRRDWNSAVVGAQIDVHGVSAVGLSRDGNRLVGLIGMFNPADPGLSGLALLSGGDGSTSLSRDGVVLGTRPFPDIASYTLPEDVGRYTLTATGTRNSRYSDLSPKIDLAWTFTSGPTTANEYLSVPTIRVNGNFDDLNRAPRFSWFPLRITAKTQEGAPESEITKVSVEVSADDGATWKQAWVQGKDAIVFHPSTGDYMSLRIKATAANGNTHEQTVIRAYGLR